MSSRLIMSACAVASSIIMSGCGAGDSNGPFPGTGQSDPPTLYQPVMESRGFVWTPDDGFHEIAPPTGVPVRLRGKSDRRTSSE